MDDDNAKSTDQPIRVSEPRVQELPGELSSKPITGTKPSKSSESSESGSSDNISKPVPAFIVGFYRSGSTLLESMLHAHPDIEGIEWM